MLLNDSQTALNLLIQAMEDSVNVYKYHADYLQDETLEQLLETVLKNREHHLERLFEMSKELGVLPKAPDIETRDVQALYSRIKAEISADERETLINELISKESEIIQLAHDAHKQDLPEHMLSYLCGLETQLAENVSHFESIQSSKRE